MNGDSPGIFSFWQSQPDREAHAPTANGDGAAHAPTANGAPNEPKESGGFVNGLMSLTEKWCCATKNVPEFVYTTTEVRADQPNGAVSTGEEPLKLRHWNPSPMAEASMLLPSMSPATFKGVRNRAKLMEGLDSEGNSLQPESSPQPEASPENFLGRVSGWTGLGLSPPRSPEGQGFSAGVATREALIPTPAVTTQSPEGQGFSAGVATWEALIPTPAVTTREVLIPDPAVPSVSFHDVPPVGLVQSPKSTFRSLTDDMGILASVPETDIPAKHSFKEWVNKGTLDSESSSPAPKAGILLSRTRSDDTGGASRGASGEGHGMSHQDMTEISSGPSRSHSAETLRRKVIHMNTHKDLRPLSGDMFSPDRQVQSLPPALARRRNTIAVTTSYTEVHKDDHHEHDVQTMQQHGKTGSRAPDHDEPTRSYVRHKFLLTVMEETSDSHAHHHTTDSGRRDSRSPSPVRQSPSNFSGPGMHESTKGSLKGSMRGGHTPKPTGHRFKRSSYEWAKAFVSQRKVSDTNYVICDDLVRGRGSQVRSAILKALADVRVLPRMDQVHVDTKTPGQIMVFISESQDIGTLIPSANSLADSLERQAKESGSRLCFNLDGYIITSVARVEDPPPNLKPKNKFNPLLRLGSSNMSPPDEEGRPDSHGSSSTPKLAHRLSRMLSRKPGHPAPG